MNTVYEYEYDELHKESNHKSKVEGKKNIQKN